MQKTSGTVTCVEAYDCDAVILVWRDLMSPLYVFIAFEHSVVIPAQKNNKNRPDQHNCTEQPIC